MVGLFYNWFLLFAFSFGFGFSNPLYTNLPVKEDLHPFYVSVTEINHNGKEKALEISCKIFADDMEAIIKQNYKTVVDVANEKQQAQNDRLISDYIIKHIALIIDGKPVSLKFIGFEKESESVFCYLEVPNISAVKKLDITNSILQDYHEEQINIMHITVGGNRKSYKLDYPNKRANFTF